MRLLTPGRVDAAIRAGLSAPRLRLWPPTASRSNPALAARVLMIRVTMPALIAAVPNAGAGRGPSPVGVASAGHAAETRPR